MGHDGSSDERRFAAYIEGLAGVIGHADRIGPLRDYCTGLIMPGERKSVEPMAAVTAPSRVAAQHQSLLHFVGAGRWSDAKVLAKVRAMVLPGIERHGPITAWIIDNTGFPKQGKHSVGVARQYCGQLGKQDNCQVAVSLSIANHHASLPVAYQLYLPKDWAADGVRRRKAGVPGTITFKTKPEIALDQLRWAVDSGLPRGVVVMDSGYGTDSDMRAAITALELQYVAGIQGNAKVWTHGRMPPPPKAGARKPKLMRDDAGQQPIAVDELALGLKKSAWRTIAWRQGSNETLTSRFARVRVRIAQNDRRRAELRAEEWLLAEWPEGEEKPAKYWFSTMPGDIPFDRLVDMTKLRWRIERDYLELKQEVGLGHYEGRGWLGFHHHATLCIAAYAFLISQREAFPPSASGTTISGAQFAVPESYRPRGAAAPA